MGSGAPIADFRSDAQEKRGEQVINKRFTVETLALFSTAALVTAQATLSAGQPQTQPRPNPQPPAATSTGEKPTATLVGCLYREDQVPGRKPNVAERSGVLEDYILADASMASGQARTEGTGGTSGTAGATGTAGRAPSSGKMYNVENLPDERLKALVGKKVEVTGKIDSEAGDTQRRPASGTSSPTADRSPGPDDIKLPEFEASSIREIPGSCPATPSVPK
jgi:hypothetical protein